MDFPYLLWRQAVGLPVAPVTTRHEASWMREITDVVAIAKSRNRKADVGRLLRAFFGGRLTSATFSFRDPLPFFAEFALWISSGISRQKKAKNFLQRDPARAKPELVSLPVESSRTVERFALADIGGGSPRHPNSANAVKVVAPRRK